jgi:cardiolipin synthase
MRAPAARIRRDLDANPGAVRSVWIAALGFFAGTFLIAVALAVAYDRSLANSFFLNTALWILPTFALVTLNIGMLRDRDDYRLSALNLPIALSLLRVVLIPGIALSLTRGHLTLALIAYLVAVMSDVADGWVARRWKQETKLGTVLDPLVDIVFGLTVFIALAAAGLLPVWVTSAAALRFGILLVGGAYLLLWVGPLRIRPTWFGKLTGVVTSALTGLLVLLHATRGRVSDALIPLTESALGVLMAGTVAYVIVLGLLNLRRMTGRVVETPGRVVGDVRWGAQ